MLPEPRTNKSAFSETSKQTTSRIDIAHIGGHVNAEQAERQLIDGRGAKRHRDAYYLKFAKGEAWFFEYGVVVCWDISKDEWQALYTLLAGLVDTPMSQPVSEQYGFGIEASAQFNIHHDFVTLPVDEPMIRLAISHAFAQSEKLVFFEERAQEVIKKNRTLAEDLAASGKIRLSRRKLSKLRGMLFATSSDITLHFNLLDTPEFFWNYPALEPYYVRMRQYLDIPSRLEILNQKLATIHALLDMLATEQNHKHSAFLEWIIILLITVDILIYFFE